MTFQWCKWFIPFINLLKLLTHLVLIEFFIFLNFFNFFFFNYYLWFFRYLRYTNLFLFWHRIRLFILDLENVIVIKIIFICFLEKLELLFLLLFFSFLILSLQNILFRFEPITRLILMKRFHLFYSTKLLWKNRQFSAWR